MLGRSSTVAKENRAGLVFDGRMALISAVVFLCPPGPRGSRSCTTHRRAFEGRGSVCLAPHHDQRDARHALPNPYQTSYIS
jgi:hypothetical protein